MYQPSNIFQKISICIFLLLCLSCFLIAQENPKVINSKLYFIGKETGVQIGTDDSYHFFSVQRRVVLIRRERKQNYSEYLITFYTYTGEKISQSDLLTGALVFIFFDSNGRVLAGQRATLTRQNESYLYDLDGCLLKILIHDYDTKQIGVTEDNNYIWFASNRMRPLYAGEKPLYNGFSYTPYNYIMIFDSIDGRFLMDSSSGETNIDIMINNKIYHIITTQPDMPG